MTSNETDAARELDSVTDEIEQGFMHFCGWKACRDLLGRMFDEKDAEIALQIKRLWMTEVGLRETEILEDCYPAESVDAELEEIKALFQIKDLKIERLKQELERAATYSGVQGSCPLCVYKNGKFIKFCELHSQIEHLNQKIAEATKTCRGY